MAGRPPKEGLDYSRWVVNIFDDQRKIDKLIDGQGAAAFTIYFYLCQRAYGTYGYYCKWSYDDAATTAKRIGGGVGSDAVIQTVNLCLRIGLFDKRLFAEHGIITSRRIQEEFWSVAKNRNRNTVINDYWLLDSSEKVAGSNNNAPKINYDRPKLNYDRPKYPHRVEERSVKKGIMPEQAPPSRNSETKIILKDGTDYELFSEDIAKWKSLYPSVDVQNEMRKMVAWCFANPSKRKTRRGINRFINSWLSNAEAETHEKLSARQEWRDFN